ncbi:MAG: 50S ribosomal protein L20 [Holosporales bacterium]|jgi:large subunit ribosomal protein L20|nr:50S ribosomal protein L20 [Holosporales bacterium]
MSRVKRGMTVRARHKKVLKQAKGYVGRSRNCYRPALERVEKALQYAFRDRRARKRDFRRLWIQRLNAAARAEGLRYSELIAGLKRAGIALDRKVMADMAIHMPTGFTSLVQRAKASLGRS